MRNYFQVFINFAKKQSETEVDEDVVMPVANSGSVSYSVQRGEAHGESQGQGHVRGVGVRRCKHDSH